MSTNIGAMIRREIPPRDVAVVARDLQHGYDELWVVEDLPYAGGISQATLALEVTDDVRVGHGIAPAPFRNPAALAMEWATLAELYPGRFIAGVGHGVQSWMAQIGERVESPLTLLEETISSVRSLLAGETVSLDGRYIHLDGVTLTYPPSTPPLVLAGVTGPKSLMLSGAVADGTVLSEGIGPDKVREARRLIEQGRQAAGRTDHHHLTVFTGFYTGPPDGLGSQNSQTPTEWDAVCETPEETAAKLQTLIDAGADSVVLVPFGKDMVGQLQLAAQRIVPLMTG
jgi:alkanesulfonate monooxygenase SsuD/methylene tetrahydromethanopterin reductase-like flavin-dependent oxidoreductase (luciferase family)